MPVGVQTVATPLPLNTAVTLPYPYNMTFTDLLRPSTNFATASRRLASDFFRPCAAARCG
jgi:hypothetical protein